MSTRVASATALLYTDTGQPVPLRLLNEGSLTIDEGWSPYVQGQLVIARPSEDVLARIDPEQGARILLRFNISNPASTRSFGLFVIGRRDTAEKIGLNVSGAEALVQRAGLVATVPNITPLTAPPRTLRSITRRVLNMVKGIPTGVDSTIRLDAPSVTYAPTKDVENLIVNGSFENASVAPWTGGNATLSASTAWKSTGVYSLGVAPVSASTDSYAELDITTQARPGKTYAVTGTVRVLGVQSGASSRARSLWVYALVDGQVVTLRQAQAQNGNVTATVTATFTVPSNATYVGLRAYAGGARDVAFSGVYWDDVAMWEGDDQDATRTERIQPFTGATPNTAVYRYEWNGLAFNSTSTRTAIDPRPADALIVTPGQSFWEFLTPLLQQSGQRLIDEATSVTAPAWRIVDNTYPYYFRQDVIDPLVIASGVNLYELEQIISLTASQDDGMPLYADAVVIRYTWRDARTGDDVEKYEAAGASPARAPYYVERRDVGYPGPGAAAYLLERLVARRRQLYVTAALDWSARPGRQVVITTTDGRTLSGYLDAVTFDLTRMSMEVKTKGLVLTPPSAWSLQPDAMTWATLPTTTTWDSFPD